VQAGPNLTAQVNSLKGNGRPLSKEERSYFEPRFGYDFSRVRLHMDGRAAEAARAMKARAFTTGREIVFGAGQYAPGTEAGRRLMAHELTHVVQQGPQKSTRPVVGSGIGRTSLSSEAAPIQLVPTPAQEGNPIADRIMRIPESSFHHQPIGQLENVSVGSNETTGNQMLQAMFTSPIIQPQLNAARSSSGSQEETDGMDERTPMTAGPEANTGFRTVTEADPCKRALDNCLHRVEVNYRKEVANCKKQHKNEPSKLEICLAMARNSRSFYASLCWADYYDCALS
jgi:hypothetical protein